ncbi:DMT family transporter [Catenuloplanes indicus]|uniref:Drug/metabolite transporter (DMT)-like permease n=1 Tax=Catenuloplanes indicus TaxID=137267 RepID=A0AAE3WA45_9ACTN|nr:DMT family transporter [Catenuloplanes indicus]MDQ0371260.1 drug/metabolite transporter (DMT)-like permease [Catenuloplanes indicus]
MFHGRRTDAVLLLVAIVWGSSYLAAKTATHDLPVLTVLLARYAISAIACLALVEAHRRSGRLTPDEIRIGALLGVTQAAVLGLETYGVAHTSAANAGLIISLTIVLTPLLDRTAGAGRLPTRFFAATGLCLLAVTLLMLGSGFHRPRLGDLLILAAAVVRAGHVVLVGRLTKDRAVRPAQLTAVQMVVGTVLFAGPAASGLPALARAGTPVWGALLYLALFCSVFAFLAQTWAVQHSSPSRASLLLGTEPVWAVVIGIGLGGETVTAFAGLGAVLMVVGTYWGQHIERAHRTLPPVRRTALGSSRT